MIITDKDYDEDVKGQSIQFQIDHYYEPKHKFFRDRIERVMSFLEPKNGEYVLDMGCGVGAFAFHAAKKGACSIGIDYSKESVNTARTIVKEYYDSGIDVSFVRGDATLLPFCDNYFDKVVSADFIEHISYEDSQKVVFEARRVLRNSGQIIMYTVNKNPQILYVFLQKVGALFKLQHPGKYSLKALNPEHIGLKTPSQCERLFARADLDYKTYLFARDLHVSQPLKAIWNVVCTKFLTILAERILIVATK